MVGYLLEELRDAKNYEQFRKDIADANIFIGSLIFIEELAEKVQSITPSASVSQSFWLQAALLRGMNATLLANSLCDLTNNDAVIMQIVETVTPRRDDLDACLVFPSMPAVM